MSHCNFMAACTGQYRPSSKIFGDWNESWSFARKTPDQLSATRMNTVPVARFAQLSIGVPRISVRYGHFRPRYKPPSPYAPKKPAGWGEKLWVFHHITTGQIAHSFTEILDVGRPSAPNSFPGERTPDILLHRRIRQ